MSRLPTALNPETLKDSDFNEESFALLSIYTSIHLRPPFVTRHSYSICSLGVVVTMHVANNIKLYSYTCV
jgi:hypothetical protein